METIADLSTLSTRSALRTPDTDASNSSTHGQQSTTEPVARSSPLHDSSPRQERHSKRVSLNFPILIPTSRNSDSTPSSYTPSPTTHSAMQSQGSFFSPPPPHMYNKPTTVLPSPLTPPSESSEENLPGQIDRKGSRRTHGRSQTVHHVSYATTTSPDFLTLLASQERRVLELKEELARAETELLEFKRQWAVHEANKKKGELRAGGVVPMGRMTSPKVSERNADHVRGVTTQLSNSSASVTGLGIHEQENSETDQSLERRREIAKQRVMRRGTLEDISEIMGNTGRKTGQRIFSGSRHTRALSLLTTSATSPMKGPMSAVDAAAVPVDHRPSTQSAVETVSTSSFTPTNSYTPRSHHTNSLDSSSLSHSQSGLARDPLNFGKTYKDLATAASGSRRAIPNLPNGLHVVNGAEVLVKHGKVVVDGVRDGLWNFFEDIRAATVGEEAAREPKIDGHVKKDGDKRGIAGNVTPRVNKTATGSAEENKETSFWKEFGVDTPKNDKIKKFSGEKGSKKPNTMEKEPSMTGRAIKNSAGVCPKHGHTHGNLLHLEEESTLDERIIEASAESPAVPSVSTPAKNKTREHEHESKLSTDSTSSRNPPSLLADSVNEGENEEDESWEWGSIHNDSPAAAKNAVDAYSRSKQHARRSVGGIQDIGGWHGLAS